MSLPLRDRHARRGKVPKLAAAELTALGVEVPGWSAAAPDGHLRRTMEFESFEALMAFVNRVAALAIAEDHHPDFSVHYRRLDLELWTHDAGGLTENDLILAAKIDALERSAS